MRVYTVRRLEHRYSYSIVAHGPLDAIALTCNVADREYGEVLVSHVMSQDHHEQIVTRIFRFIRQAAAPHQWKEVSG